MKKLFLIITAVIVTGGLSGCAGLQPKISEPAMLVAPTPIADNSGEFMSPYTTDGVMAEWVDKSVNASLGASIGGVAGAFAGQQLAGQIPFVGGIVGNYIGKTAGRAIALEMAGGEEFMRESSDLSFNNLDNMALYIYVKHSSHEHYADALKATMEIYPDLKQRYSVALVSASGQVTPY